MTRLAHHAAPLLGLVMTLVACGETSESAAVPAVAAVRNAPDLVLVLVDTLRADHLSAYGYHRTTSPHMDGLASAGTLFLDTTAQASWTLPSVASLFTGRNVFQNVKRMPDSVPSLAERLSRAGYETAAFVGNPAVGTHGGYDRGFEHFVTRDDTGGVTWDASALVQALEQWRAEHPRDGRPRFLYLHFLDPHFPYAPRSDEPLAEPLRLRDDVLATWVEEAQTEGPLREAFDRDRRHIEAEVDAYDREIRQVDAALARILDRLPGDVPRLVIISSDHGEGLWDHRHHAGLVEREVEPQARTLREVFFRDHSYHMYQELLRTPLIVAGPGFDAGLRVATPVANVDILPTLLRAAGLPDDPTLDGRALQDVAAGAAASRPVIYAHSNEATVVRDTSTGDKLIFPTDTGFSYGMPIMLFNVERDAHERDDRYERARSGDTQGLRHLLRLREQALETFDLYEHEPIDVEAAAQLEILRELGYLGEGFAGKDARRPDGAAPDGR